MLRLALEIPTSMLRQWTALTDLDFILAHKVLADDEYASFFRERPIDRELILDNSTHEFGHPIPLSDLRKSAELCRADIVIAPDIVNEQIDEAQYRQNLQWLRECGAEFKGTGYILASVLCGLTPEQRTFYADVATEHAGVMCFTFHDRHRLQWFDEFRQNPEFMLWDRIHILGVSSIDEMREWVRISDSYPSHDFSIDTTKAVKWGAQLKEIDKLESLRGGPIDAKAVLELKEFTPQQIECVEYNIDFLKKVCRGIA